jgi:catalase
MIRFPQWTLKVQTMTLKQAEEVWREKKINVFDLTHIWPHGDFPLREIGKLTLNENAKVSRV